MQNATMAISGVFIVLLVISAGIIVLQIWLSKRDSKWPGLVLPMISLGVSFVAVLGVLLFSAQKQTTTLLENGRVIEQSAEVLAEPALLIASASYTFLINSTPTVILTLIYAACRSKQTKRRALNKMSVQDLE